MFLGSFKRASKRLPLLSAHVCSCVFKKLPAGLKELQVISGNLEEDFRRFQAVSVCFGIQEFPGSFKGF